MLSFPNLWVSQTARQRAFNSVCSANAKKPGACTCLFIPLPHPRRAGCSRSAAAWEFSDVRVLRRNAPSEHIYRENASFPVNKNPRNLSITRIVWRRRRDLNSRADFSTYSLSRGAPSPAWVRLHVKCIQLNRCIGGTGGIHFLRKIHGGCNMPLAYCQEPPFESLTHPIPNLAERVGFEPTRPFGQTVFKTASL